MRILTAGYGGFMFTEPGCGAWKHGVSNVVRRDCRVTAGLSGVTEGSFCLWNYGSKHLAKLLIITCISTSSNSKKI